MDSKRRNFTRTMTITLSTDAYTRHWALVTYGGIVFPG